MHYNGITLYTFITSIKYFTIEILHVTSFGPKGHSHLWQQWFIRYRGFEIQRTSIDFKHDLSSLKKISWVCKKSIFSDWHVGSHACISHCCTGSTTEIQSCQDANLSTLAMYVVIMTTFGATHDHITNFHQNNSGFLVIVKQDDIFTMRANWAINCYSQYQTQIYDTGIQ